MSELRPLTATSTAHLFAPLGRELVKLLGALEPEQWQRQTVAPRWVVADVAAHLLDSALRRLSAGRDGHFGPPPEESLDDYSVLVAFLDRLNAEWVTASRRLSPRVLTEAMAWAEPQLADHFSGLDPRGPALFAVSWAGEEESRCWFDVARELTERWHHQQQIRLAVGAAPYRHAETSGAIFDTFLRVLPHKYREVDAPDGTALAVRIEGVDSYCFTLLRRPGAWELMGGLAAQPAVSIELEEEPAWLVLTKGLRPEEAMARARIAGDARLAEPFFGSVAIMG